MAKLKIFIDQDKCVGAGQCVFAAPEVFDQREDDGIVELLAEEPEESQHGAVMQAVRLCPAKAIRVEEA
ncbi:ferredoxin [Oceanibacterium hippocampi]|uniref:Ferredoxin n=1 Tax=Oceanibacterium hippocampi TaxID=745714 RepID=A0A1Y5TT50_9PROT|nr:ferredoxin [Oceanibacterium hippocampi]SLN71907.1 Ferredoxin-2 [Oceanibacterium hippocampi]